uniref:Uncharacterized protein n=1 Tax=Vespula pensylvanica TaxID=30213 RepID=A0A834UBJ4_VESPE|nr:hypothetical protein H0235_005729 [Vespula pensylvanica]
MPDHDSCSVVRISTVSSGRGDICHLNTENQGSNSSQVSGSSRSFGGCKFGLALASQRTGLNESRKMKKGRKSSHMKTSTYGWYEDWE